MSCDCHHRRVRGEMQMCSAVAHVVSNLTMRAYTEQAEGFFREVSDALMRHRVSPTGDGRVSGVDGSPWPRFLASNRRKPSWRSARTDRGKDSCRRGCTNVRSCGTRVHNETACTGRKRRTAREGPARGTAARPSPLSSRSRRWGGVGGEDRRQGTRHLQALPADPAQERGAKGGIVGNVHDASPSHADRDGGNR